MATRRSGTISTGGLYTAPTGAGQHTITATSGSLSTNVTVYVTNYAGTFTAHNDNGRTGENLARDRPDAREREHEQLRQAVLLPARRADVRLAALRRERLDPGPGRTQRRLRRDRARLRVRVRRGRAVEHAAVEGFVHQPVGRGQPDSAVGHRRDGGHPERDRDHRHARDRPDRRTPSTWWRRPRRSAAGRPSTSTGFTPSIISTGAEKPGSPVVINPSVPGTGIDAVNGTVSFNNITENQRASLLLVGNEVYVGFANHGNNPPYHGWVVCVQRVDPSSGLGVLHDLQRGQGRDLDGRRRDRGRQRRQPVLLDRQRHVRSEHRRRRLRRHAAQAEPRAARSATTSRRTTTRRSTTGTSTSHRVA